MSVSVHSKTSGTRAKKSEITYNISHADFFCFILLKRRKPGKKGSTPTCSYYIDISALLKKDEKKKKPRKIQRNFIYQAFSWLDSIAVSANRKVLSSKLEHGFVEFLGSEQSSTPWPHFGLKYPIETSFQRRISSRIRQTFQVWYQGENGALKA